MVSWLAKPICLPCCPEGMLSKNLILFELGASHLKRGGMGYAMSQNRVGGAVIAAVIVLVVAWPSSASPSDRHDSSKQRCDRAIAALHQRMQPFVQAYQATEWPADSPQEIGKLLHGDPRVCAAFVRTRLRYEPYEGILRGPDGALAAGGGNSADLALLLKEMIGAADSPPKVQFVIAPLTDEQGNRLLQRAVSQPPAATVVAAMSAKPLIPNAPGEQTEPATGESFLADARADLDQLRPMLKDLNPPDAQIRRRTLQAARQHVWLRVEQREGSLVLDPSGDLPIPAGGAQVLDQLPEDWNQQVNLTVEVERTSDGKLIRDAVLECHWNTAALYGRALELEIIPRQLSLPAMFDGKESSGFLDQARRFEVFDVAISLAGDEPITGKSFDVKGNPLAANQQDIGGQVNPFGAFHRPGQSPAPQSELAGVWLTISSIAPGDKPHRIERALLDRIGPAARERGSTKTAENWNDLQRVRVALFQRHQILIGGGNISENRLARDVLDSIVKGQILDRSLAVEYGQAPGPLSQQIVDLPIPALPAEPIALQRMPATLAQAGISGQGICFAATPQVFILNQTFDLTNGKELIAHDDLDIAQNDLLFLAEPEASGDAILLHGLWASELEGELLRRRVPASLHAAGILRAASREGIAMRRLQNPKDLESIAAGEDAKAMMERQLAEGNVLIAPVTSVKVNDVPRFACWRIDPSGQILAIGADGRGQAGSEGLYVLKKISIPMVKRCMKFVYCFNKAVAGGGNMSESAADCLSDSIKEIVKDSLDTAIDTFITDPVKDKVSEARKGMLGKEYNELYQKAKKTYEKYEKAEKTIADPAGAVPGINDGRKAAKGGREIGESLGWRLYLLMNDGRQIAHYASEL